MLKGKIEIRNGSKVMSLRADRVKAGSERRAAQVRSAEHSSYICRPFFGF